MQAVQIEIAIADVIGVWTVLDRIPNFFPTKDYSVEPGKSPVVLGAHGHVRYSAHDKSSWFNLSPSVSR